MIWQEVITELSIMKIYLNSRKQRLGVTSLSARLLSLGTLSPSRGRAIASGITLLATTTNILHTSPRFINFIQQLTLILPSLDI